MTIEQMKNELMDYYYYKQEWVDSMSNEQIEKQLTELEEQNSI